MRATFHLHSITYFFMGEIPKTASAAPLNGLAVSFSYNTIDDFTKRRSYDVRIGPNDAEILFDGDTGVKAWGKLDVPIGDATGFKGTGSWLQI